MSMERIMEAWRKQVLVNEQWLGRNLPHSALESGVPAVSFTKGIDFDYQSSDGTGHQRFLDFGAEKADGYLTFNVADKYAITGFTHGKYSHMIKHLDEMGEEYKTVLTPLVTTIRQYAMVQSTRPGGDKTAGLRKRDHWIRKLFGEVTGRFPKLYHIKNGQAELLGASNLELINISTVTNTLDYLHDRKLFRHNFFTGGDLRRVNQGKITKYLDRLFKKTPWNAIKLVKSFLEGDPSSAAKELLEKIKGSGGKYRDLDRVTKREVRTAAEKLTNQQASATSRKGFFEENPDYRDEDGSIPSGEERRQIVLRAVQVENSFLRATLPLVKIYDGKIVAFMAAPLDCNTASKEEIKTAWLAGRVIKLKLHYSFVDKFYYLRADGTVLAPSPRNPMKFETFFKPHEKTVRSQNASFKATGEFCKDEFEAKKRPKAPPWDEVWDKTREAICNISKEEYEEQPQESPAPDPVRAPQTDMMMKMILAAAAAGTAAAVGNALAGGATAAGGTLVTAFVSRAHLMLARAAGVSRATLASTRMAFSGLRASRYMRLARLGRTFSSFRRLAALGRLSRFGGAYAAVAGVVLVLLVPEKAEAAMDILAPADDVPDGPETPKKLKQTGSECIPTPYGINECAGSGPEEYAQMIIGHIEAEFKIGVHIAAGKWCMAMDPENSASMVSPGAFDQRSTCGDTSQLWKKWMEQSKSSPDSKNGALGRMLTALDTEYGLSGHLQVKTATPRKPFPTVSQVLNVLEYENNIRLGQQKKVWMSPEMAQHALRLIEILSAAAIESKSKRFENSYTSAVVNKKHNGAPVIHTAITSWLWDWSKVFEIKKKVKPADEEKIRQDAFKTATHWYFAKVNNGKGIYTRPLAGIIPHIEKAFGSSIISSTGKPRSKAEKRKMMSLDPKADLRRKAAQQAKELGIEPEEAEGSTPRPLGAPKTSSPLPRIKPRRHKNVSESKKIILKIKT